MNRRGGQTAWSGEVLRFTYSLPCQASLLPGSVFLDNEPYNEIPIKPSRMANQKVTRRISMVPATAAPLSTPLVTSSPVMLPSATPNPPGIIDSAPASEANTKIKVCLLYTSD